MQLGAGAPATNRISTRRAIALVGVMAAAWAPAPAGARADGPPSAGVGDPSATEHKRDRQAVRPPSLRRGSTVARIAAPTFARAHLRSARRGWPVSPQTAWSGQQQRLLVLDATSRHGREWVKVLLAARPNGSAGWIPRDKVVLERTRYWIELRTRLRQVTVFHDGKRLQRFRAVVGAPVTPTPHGLAAIYERNRQPNPGGFLGPWALPLTIFSNVLKNFGGGPGRVAIHGRAGASLLDPLGSARSHGCIRITNRRISWIADNVPAGTPVRIRR
jgi:lipoprotein-anchoring transpeptidase ErfK/SrfK